MSDESDYSSGWLKYDLRVVYISEYNKLKALKIYIQWYSSWTVKIIITSHTSLICPFVRQHHITSIVHNHKSCCDHTFSCQFQMRISEIFYVSISCKSSLVCIIAPPPTHQQQMCDQVWCSWSPCVICVIWNMTIVGSGHDVGSVTQHLFTLHANPLSLVDYFTFALKEDHETYLNIFKSMVCLIIYKSTCFTVVIKLQCITAYLET